MHSHSSPLVFNRHLLRKRRDRAAAECSQYDFMLEEMHARLSDRLRDITRHFPLCLELGAHGGTLAAHLPPQSNITTLIQADLSGNMVAQARGIRLVADEEALPFAPNIFDAVISSGSLHWVNDLPGALAQIQHCLKPDGVFLAIFPGGDSLPELRQSLEHAEHVITGGLAPRLSPFVDIRDAGSLLQRAGFALPVVDSEVITVEYNDPLRLLHDIRGMGESNALYHRAPPLRRNVLHEALRYYKEHFTLPNGRVRASMELITLTGWKPHASQPQPLARGSGQVHFKDVL